MTPPATPTPARGALRPRGHSPKTVAFARQLADSGWTPHEIQQMLDRNGVKVTWGTVRAWVDDDYRVKRNHVTAQAKRIDRDKSHAYLGRQLRRLRERGLTEEALRVIAEEYHGVTLNRDTVRRHLGSRQPVPAAGREEAHDAA